MKPAHADWIRAYEAKCGGGPATLGKCREAVEEMVAQFPELTLVRGHVDCPPPWNRRAHWWTKRADGTIVDPTVGQFVCGILRYEEYKEGDPVRLGKCMNCGVEIWGPPGKTRASVCSEDCERILMESFD